MNKTKILLSLIVVCIMITILNAGAANASEANITYLNDSLVSEEKIYCTATLEDNFTDNHVLVVLTNAASLASQEYNASLFAEIDCVSVENQSQQKTDLVKQMLAGEPLPENDIAMDLSCFHQCFCLTLARPGKENVLAAVHTLEQRADILYAGPNHIYHLKEYNDDFSSDVGNLYIGSSTSYSNAATSLNDTYAENQWGISTIDLDAAWSITTGSSCTITVGILDTGIDGGHPDLAGKVSVSKSRDCLSGFSAGVAQVTDPVGHGTMIAGIIGAIPNNGIGVAGINWNVELVSFRVIDENNNSHESYIYAAITSAAEQGIPILNMSFSDFERSGYVEAAMSEYTGLMICSAGNNYGDIDSIHVYPACTNNSRVLSIGASNMFDVIWAGSNYGANYVDLFAPGAPIYSTMSRSTCSATSCGAIGSHVGYSYHADGGTSLAAPYVAGVASLLLSLDDDLSAAQLKYHIMNGVDVKSAYQGKCVTGGRLNAYKVLSGHSCYYMDDGSSGHYKSCVCGLNIFEDHSFSEIGGLWVCSDCGFAY